MFSVKKASCIFEFVRQSEGGAAMACRPTPAPFCPLLGRFSGCGCKRFFVVFIPIWILNLLRLSPLLSILLVCTPVLRLPLVFLLFSCYAIILCSCCERWRNLHEGILPEMSTPKMLTPRMLTLKTSIPKVSTSQNFIFWRIHCIIKLFYIPQCWNINCQGHMEKQEIEMKWKLEKKIIKETNKKK